MTHPETSTEDALDRAGRILAESWHLHRPDAGVRVIASTALSQIMAGLPAAARGMLATLPEADLRQIAGAAMQMMELAADELPEGADARRHTDEMARPEVALGLFHGRLFSYAVGGDLAGVDRGLADVGTFDLYTLHRGATALLRRIEKRLPGLTGE